MQQKFKGISIINFKLELKKDLSICILKNEVLHVQDEALYKLDYTNLNMENMQFSYVVI